MDNTKTIRAAADALVARLGESVSTEPWEDGWHRLSLPERGVTAAAWVYGSEVHPAGVGSLADALDREASPPEAVPRVVVLNYASRRTAARLREWGVGFLDTAGNAFLDADGCFIYVVGQKRPEGARESLKAGAREVTPDRAFTPAGLRIVFALLADPAPTTATYREIADAVGVSRGSVGVVVKALEAAGYVETRGTTRSLERTLRRQDDLRSRWATGYAETLRPRLARMRLRFTNPREADERVRALPPGLGRWSGEPAADLLTGHLAPGHYTLFSDAPASELARALKAVRDDDGDVEVLRPFWQEEWDDTWSREHLLVAHPLLVWADLLAVGEARGRDAATAVLDLWRDHLERTETEATARAPRGRGPVAGSS